MADCVAIQQECIVAGRATRAKIVSQYKNCIVTEAGQCCIAIQSLGHDTALGAQAGVRGARRRAAGSGCWRARALAGRAGAGWQQAQACDRRRVRQAGRAEAGARTRQERTGRARQGAAADAGARGACGAGLAGP